MARGVNKVILVGHLGADPDVRYSASGNAVTRFRLATSESWKDRQSGELQERTEWHQVVTFGRLAEVCGEYLRKGSQVYIEGKLQTSSYEKNGETRYSTEIVASEMHMLGSASGGGGGSHGGGGRSRGAPPAGGARPASAPPAVDPDFDDDIPF